MSRTATPPLPALVLQLHGDACVLAAGRAVLPLRGRAAALVALAALEPGISRERAAALLWPDADGARRNLRQQLLRFRQALGRPLLEGEDRLQLADGVALQAPAPAAPLLAAESAGEDDFGLWLATQRRRLAQAQQQPLEQALAEAEARGDLDAALHQARALLALDPADEARHATLMRVHYLRGEPAAGLAAYQALADRLAGQLGTRPAAATRELALALRRLGDGALQPAAARTSLPVTLRRPPVLAGRRAERAALQAAWDEGRVVLLEGEAGMGKSRLLADWLAQAGAGVLQAAGRPGDAGAPYSTLARLLHPLLEAAPAGLGAPARTALALLGWRPAGGSGADAAGPRAARSPARTPAGSPVPASAAPSPLAPGALQAAVAELLDCAGITTVALDDLHFADAATLELISGLAAQESPRRWLLAQRPAEAPAAAPTLRDDLLELQRLTVVRLPPLDEAATVELVDALGVPGLQGPALAGALVRHSGGNPLFLLETIKQGLADGSLARGELPRPAGVGALIERRLRQLSEPALVLARVAAIAGVDFRIELAEAAIGHSAVQLASAWQELQDAQVLRDEGFAHDLVADAVLRGVPPVVARRVHAQCAQWLQAHGGEPARVARHWRSGGRPAEAATAFVQAARRAGAAARQAEEADLYGEAAAAHAEAGDPRARFEALAARVSALCGARADTASLAEAETLADAACDDAQRVRATRVLVDLQGQRGPFERAVELGLPGIELARRAGAHEEHVRLAGVVAGNLCKLGRAPEAYTLLLPLREWVDACGDDGLRHIWYGYWAATLGHIGRLREGVAAYDEAAAAATRRGDRPGQSAALLNQCVVLRTLGAQDRARDSARRGLALSPDDSDNTSHRLARLMVAREQAETGELGDALAALEDLLKAFQDLQMGFWVGATRSTLARLWQHLGQHARALQALPDPQAPVPAWMQASDLWLRLEVNQWLGQPPAAASVAQALALVDGDVHRRTGNAVRGLRFAAPQAVLDQAADWAARALEHELFGVLAALRLHEARAALALQQPARAAVAARALLALLAEGYAPAFSYTPEAGLVAGQALRAAGDVAAAQRALDDAVDWVRRRALPQVPAPFIDSFLHRNPVNRELLALAGAAPRR